MVDKEVQTEINEEQKSKVDYVRFHLGDNDENDLLFTDEELVALLEVLPSKESVVEACLQNLVMRYAKEVNYKIGPESVEAGQRYKNYKVELQEWRRNKQNQNAFPLVSGAEDKPWAFQIGLHDGEGDPYGSTST